MLTLVEPLKIMNTGVDFSVLHDCKVTLAALDKLRMLTQGVKGDTSVIKEAEYKVHLSSRTLLAHFVDVAAWPGFKLNIATHKAIEDILRSAVKLVTTDPNCVRSVRDRLKEFNGLVRRFPPCS